MREVARGVAGRLELPLVDEEVILLAAAEAGVEPGMVADVERRRSFIARALATVGPATTGATTFGPGGIDSFYSGSLAAPPPGGNPDLRGFIRAAIEEIAEHGNVVIAAHAASHALAEQPDVLRVLVTASRSTRQTRLVTEQNLNEEDGARLVDASDAARADYLKRFYGARTELPTQYDIVLNTDRLSADEVVSIVAFAARN
jgi:Cytidylate kinase-like family